MPKFTRVNLEKNNWTKFKFKFTLSKASIKFMQILLSKVAIKVIYLGHGQGQRENTIRDSLQKFITLQNARSVGISLRLVQNACKN